MLRELHEDLVEVWAETTPFERVVLALCMPAFVIAWVIVFVLHD